MQALKRVYLHLSLGLVVLAMGLGSASAAIVRIDSAASVIQTSGGITGKGYGDLALSGTFEVTQPRPKNLSFDEFDIEVTPEIASPDVDIEDLLFNGAIYDGFNFENGLACIAVVGVICPEARISGTFDGKNFYLEGYYFSNIADDYSYTTILKGTVIPLPAAGYLLLSGLVGLVGYARRQRLKVC